jgi:hypothetical protein
VKPTTSKIPTIFEPVVKHHSSVVNAAAKFGDIARLENAPSLVAVVHNKSRFGTYLGVLSQNATVIDDEAPDRTIVRLASAA